MIARIKRKDLIKIHQDIMDKKIQIVAVGKSYKVAYLQNYKKYCLYRSCGEKITVTPLLGDFDDVMYMFDLKITGLSYRKCNIQV